MARPLAGRTILVADDERRLRLVVELMLDELGARVVSCADGVAAVTMLEQARGTIDLALLDLRMQGLSGLEVYERTHDADPRLRFVFTSGLVPDAELDALIRGRGIGFLEKPYSISDLEQVLCRVLAPPT